MNPRAACFLQLWCLQVDGCDLSQELRGIMLILGKECSFWLQELPCMATMKKVKEGEKTQGRWREIQLS